MPTGSQTPRRHLAAGGDRSPRLARWPRILLRPPVAGGMLAASMLLMIGVPLALGDTSAASPAQTAAVRATQSLSALASTLYPSGPPSADCDDPQQRYRNPGACLNLTAPSTGSATPTSRPTPTQSSDHPAPDDPTSGGEVPEIEVDPDRESTTDADTGDKDQPSPGEGEEDCGTFDVICKIGRGINQWFTDLVTGAMRPVIDTIADTTLATPNVTGNGDIVELHSITRWVANGVFVLFVVAGGFVVASHETLQTRYTLREVLPRIVVGFVAVNASLAIIGMAVDATNAVTAAVLAGDPGSVSRSLKQELTGQLEQGGIFMILVALVVLVLAVILLAIYVVRLALTVIVVVAAPLALVCHAFPYSEGIARMWWRALFAVLSIQLLQAITLIVFVRVFFVQGGDTNRGILGVSGQLMNLIVSAVLLFILIKIPFWVLRNVTPGHQNSAILTIIKYSLVAKGLSAIGITRHGGRARPTGHDTRPPRGGTPSRAAGGASGGMAGAPVGGRPQPVGGASANRESQTEPTRTKSPATRGDSAASEQPGSASADGIHNTPSARRAHTANEPTDGRRPGRADGTVTARRAHQAARRAWTPVAQARDEAPASTPQPTSSRPGGVFTPLPTRPAPPLESTPAGAGKPVSSPADARPTPPPTNWKKPNAARGRRT